MKTVKPEIEKMTASFPVFRFSCLIGIMLVNCLSVAFIFPFLGFYIVHLKIAENTAEAGKAAGLVASMFFVGRAASGFLWGLFADKFGRKPAMLLSMLFTCVCMLGFGFCQNLWQLLAWRAAAGLLNGLVAITKVVAFELVSRPEDVNRAQAWVQSAWGIGLILGPGLGGMLSEPCSEDSMLVDLVDPESLVCQYPFSLPCIVGAMLNLLMVPALYALPETGQNFCGASQRRSLKYEVVPAANQDEPQKCEIFDSCNNASLEDNSNANEQVEKVESKVLQVNSDVPTPTPSGPGLCQARFVILCVVQGLSIGSMIMTQELASLWAILPVSRGGPQWSAETLGDCWAAFGIVLLSVQFLVLPRIINCLGNRLSMQWGLLLNVFAQAVLPFAALLNPRPETVSDGFLKPRFSILAVFISITCLQQFLNQMIVCPLGTYMNKVVDASLRGRAMGLSSAIQNVGMAFAPSLVGAVLASTIADIGDEAADPLSSFPAGVHPAFLLSSLVMLLSFVLFQCPVLKSLEELK